MAGKAEASGDWIDGFLFLGNQLALDFLNTRPVLDRGADGAPVGYEGAGALARSPQACSMSPLMRARTRRWRDSPKAEAFLKKLPAFREELRDRGDSSGARASQSARPFSTSSTDYCRNILRGWRSSGRRRSFRSASCSSLASRRTSGRRSSRARRRSALGACRRACAQMRIRSLRPALLRHEQEGLAPLVQHESLRQQGEGGRLQGAQPMSEHLVEHELAAGPSRRCGSAHPRLHGVSRAVRRAGAARVRARSVGAGAYPGRGLRGSFSATFRTGIRNLPIMMPPPRSSLRRWRAMASVMTAAWCCTTRVRTPGRRGCGGCCGRLGFGALAILNGGLKKWAG